MKKLFSLSIAAFLIIGANLNAQNIKLGLGGGVLFLQKPDYVTRGITDGGMGLTSGYNLTAEAKFRIPALPASALIFYDYSYLKERYEKNGGYLQYQSSVFAWGAGAEAYILKGPISPYAGVNLFVFKMTFDESTNMMMTDEVRYPFKTIVSYGLGLSAGTEIDVIPRISVDIKLKYNLYNLFKEIEFEDYFDRLGKKDFSGIALSALILYNF